MLARANRVVRADDYRTTVRRGRRVGTAHTVIYFAPRAIDEPTRFGFIVAKSVGGAVRRNVVRRRMKAIGYELVRKHGEGTDIVIRALPGSDEVSWSTLHSEIVEAVDRGVERR